MMRGSRKVLVSVLTVVLILGFVYILVPVPPSSSGFISSMGGFILVHVSTPLEVCETRDRKGLYAKARSGIIKQFTGISDPYEKPDDAAIVIDTTDISPEEAVQEVILHLEKEGYIGT